MDEKKSLLIHHEFYASIKNKPGIRAFLNKAIENEVDLVDINGAEIEFEIVHAVDENNIHYFKFDVDYDEDSVCVIALSGEQLALLNEDSAHILNVPTLYEGEVNRDEVAFPLLSGDILSVKCPFRENEQCVSPLSIDESGVELVDLMSLDYSLLIHDIDITKKQSVIDSQWTGDFPDDFEGLKYTERHDEKALAQQADYDKKKVDIMLPDFSRGDEPALNY